ncbi:MAG: FtsX-like permease family protein, partial [Lachnospiraceae bacterium]|nr:FtsX-like permease family protein [Lachnospiraceae bacterium]
TLRNAARSAKDYLIYLATMSFITALMFAFNGMIFSRDMRAIYGEIEVFIALVGVASFFIVIIVIWLVHYIVNFMIEKRSREFGTYLLLGINKKKIARMFRNENILLGILSLLIGILPGLIAQKLFINVFYAIMDSEYRITAEFNLPGLLLTGGVVLLSYLFALFNIKRKFKKMQIRDLMEMDKHNEEIHNEKRTWKKVLVAIAVSYIIFFNVMVFRSMMNQVTVSFFILGLIVSIYLLFIGLSSLFVDMIRKKYQWVYRSANLFIMRQLSSKIKTMRFTMGTLSILFTAALLGWMSVMMFADFQRREMTAQIPFDVMVYSDHADDDFQQELAVIGGQVPLRDHHIYRIYQNGTSVVNEFLYAHRNGTYRTEVDRNGKSGSSTYFEYDTYMGLSDYNRIRGMIGLEPVTIAPGSYLLHGKRLVDQELISISGQLEIKVGAALLACQEIRMEPISQEGMNGADYILVVADVDLKELTPYYSLLAASLDGSTPPDLQQQLIDMQDYYSEEDYQNIYAVAMGSGSGQVLSWSDTVLVSDNLIKEMNFILTAFCFVLAYIGLVFLCTALTILAVQQLSDSAKYRFRYTILKQLGVSEPGIHAVVRKQLVAYYLCPLIVSILLSMFIGLFASERFVYYTGIDAMNFHYYLLGVVVFTFLYAVYFVISYTGFIKNISKLR